MAHWLGSGRTSGPVGPAIIGTSVLIGLLSLLIVVGGCRTGARTEVASGSPAKLRADYLIKPQELAGWLGRPDVVIIDSRPTEAYDAFHLPGAVNIPKNLFRTPEDLAYKAKHGFAVSPEKAAQVFSAAGVAPGVRVVAYDSVTFPDASVVWALLTYYGHPDVRVLDGGYEKWTREGRPVTARTPASRPGNFQPRPRPKTVATTDWLRRNLKRVAVLDMRTFEEYLGVNPAGNVRGGSVPGAANIEWAELAKGSTVGSAAEMQQLLDFQGVTKDKEVVTYCNWGIGRATYGFMVLKMLGYERVRIYGGSMEDWSAHTELPIGDMTNIPAAM